MAYGPHESPDGQTHAAARACAGWRSVTLLILTVLGIAGAGAYLRDGHVVPAAPTRTATALEYEQYARAEFFRHYPGQRPLNWRLAETAVRFHRERPMGKFVLALESGQWGNDCSDFVDCIADEALGAGARCFRDSKHHLLGTSPRYFDYFLWDGKSPIMPGDLILVRHSPWYEPDPAAGWHVGIMGPEGMTYDFAKLKRWTTPRYGRNSLAWFVRYSRGPGEVVIGRLRAQYRYRMVEPQAGGERP